MSDKEDTNVLVGHTHTPEQRAVYEKIRAQGICPFCWENFSLHHPNPILRKGENWLVTKNAWPYKGSRTHILLVARRHIVNVTELTHEEWAELFEMYRWTIETEKLQGGSLFIRFGDGLYNGSSVPHLHSQLVTGVIHTDETDPLMVVLGYKEKT